MAEKKGVRNAKIGLGISVVLLVLSLMGNAWFYTEMTNLSSEYNYYKYAHHYNDSQYWDLVDAVYQLEHEIDELEDQVYRLEHKLSQYESILNMEKSNTILNLHHIIQEPGGLTTVKLFECPYAGYLNLSGTSTTSTFYVKIQFWYQDRLFSFRETLGTSGQTVFLVLPADRITIYVGNTNGHSRAYHTISVTYHY